MKRIKKIIIIFILLTDVLKTGCGNGKGNEDAIADQPFEEIPIPDMEAPDGPNPVEEGDLAIISVRAVAITSTSALISWYTFIPADSQVEYGTGETYDSSTPVDNTITTNHHILITELTPDTQYHYRVKSVASDGTLGVSSDYTFKTLPDLCTTGKTHYVDVDSRGGDGTSWQSAWASPEEIEWNVITPGDCVVFAQGIYNDSLRVEASGNPDLPISIYPAESAVLTGNIIVPDEQHDIIIRGFEITSSDPDPSARGVDISIRGSNVIFTENFLHHTNGIGVGGNNNKAVNNLLWFAHGVSMTIWGTNSVLENNDVSHSICGFWGDADTSRFFGTGNIIRGNFFHDVLSEESPDCHPHCDCFQTYSVNPGEEAHNITIENNYCYNICGQMFMGEGIIEQQTHSNITFRGNIFEKVGAIAINASGILNMILDHNTFVDAGIGAIGIDNVPGGIITSNLFYKNPFSYSCAECAIDYNWIYPFDCHIDFNEQHGTYGIDPLFKNEKNHNFTPVPGSRACSAGQGGSHAGAIPCEPVTVCYDVDGDGYGKPVSNYCLHNEEDCDNFNPEAYPGHTEICTDSADNNCDGFRNEDCPDARPILYLKFDGNIDNSSSNNFTIKWEGGSGNFGEGHDGQAISLSGGNSAYVVVSDDPLLNGMGLLTISVWAKKANADKGGTIFLKHVYYTLNIGADSVDCYIQTENEEIDLDTYQVSQINDTNWHNYKLIYDSRTGEAKLLIDDSIIKTAAGTGPVRKDPCDLRDIYIGKNPWGDAFDGLIDEFKIYDTVFE